MEEDEDECLPPIMIIPSEIRATIFKRLSQLEVVQLRLVCRQWRNEVDEFAEFSVQLDDRLPTLNRILQLRIAKCKIVHFQGPPPLGTGTTIFKHPNLIRVLKIRTDKISTDNFLYLLSDCAEYVQVLSAILTVPLLTCLAAGERLNWNFENLRQLTISLSSLPEGAIMGSGPPRNIKPDNLFEQMLAHYMPKLNSLSVQLKCLGMQEISRLTSKIISFILRHERTLETLDFDLIQGHGMPPSELRPLASEDLECIDLLSLNKFQRLKAIRVVNSTAVGIDLWLEILQNQKQLQFVETDILPAPDTLFRQIILNNQSSLVQVDFGDLTIGDPESEDELERSRPFNLSVFKNCTNLRKLTLDRNSMRRRTGPERSELINLFELPRSIEELAINYFLILSDELLIMLSSGLGPNLTSLTLSQCGSSGDFGVDGSVLELIVSLQNINFMELSPLNFSNPEEKVKLNLILTTFGYQQNHCYFSLSRVNQPQVDMSDFEP